MQNANKKLNQNAVRNILLRAIRPFIRRSLGVGRFAHSPIRLFLYFLFLFFAACYEPRDGCLEIEATNFDASADKNCCCTYPEFKLSLLPRFDTLVWKPDTAYEYAPGQWFRLRQAVFYLSNFQLEMQSELLSVSDTVNLSVWGGAGDTTKQVFVDDFALFRRTVVDYTIGSFRPSGTIESLRFHLGLPDSAQQIIPELVPEGHPLRLQNENLWLDRSTGYAALKLVLTRDTLSTTAPDTLYFSRPEFNSLVIQQNGPFQHESGYDFTLKLTADFREMFRNVDLSGGDKSVWKTQIIANLPQAFRVTQ